MLNTKNVLLGETNLGRSMILSVSKIKHSVVQEVGAS
jgi:hypothetical protein